MTAVCLYCGNTNPDDLTTDADVTFCLPWCCGTSASEESK